ncbi:MAG: EAL domain-containing protein [Dehalococcoidia bacterium]|nr:EAL domain-containing protein [Dehalococcoidia bacterium]
MTTGVLRTVGLMVLVAALGAPSAVAGATSGTAGDPVRISGALFADASLLAPSLGALVLLAGVIALVYWRLVRRRRTLPRRPSITSETVAAAQLNEFGVHFQPVVSAASGAIVGAEALVRWEQRGAEVTTARQFFARAANAGILDDVIARAIRPACDFARDCLDATNGSFRLHINLSKSQLQAGQATVEVIEHALRESQLVPWALQVEVPEQALVEIGPSVTATLKAMSDLGVHIAIDDFWGQDETYWVLSIPGVTAVKLDLRANTSGDASRASLANAARIAQTRDLIVGAKRVESTFEQDFAAEIGCTEVQGHAYGRPMDAREFKAYAAEELSPDTLAS